MRGFGGWLRILHRVGDSKERRFEAGKFAGGAACGHDDECLWGDFQRDEQGLIAAADSFGAGGAAGADSDFVGLTEGGDAGIASGFACAGEERGKGRQHIERASFSGETGDSGGGEHDDADDKLPRRDRGAAAGALHDLVAGGEEDLLGFFGDDPASQIAESE